jgi:hypothetical protein
LLIAPIPPTLRSARQQADRMSGNFRALPTLRVNQFYRTNWNIFVSVSGASVRLGISNISNIFDGTGFENRYPCIS